jgi:hypothetical protein
MRWFGLGFDAGFEPKPVGETQAEEERRIVDEFTHKADIAKNSSSAKNYGAAAESLATAFLLRRLL